MKVSTYDPTAQSVTMTAAAIRHFERALEGREGQIVRLSTKESGCTGYAYVLDLVDAAQHGDVVLHPGENIALAVDAEAIKLLSGTEIDLVTEGVNTVVKFNNPNVVAQCGCGESFSVQ